MVPLEQAWFSDVKENMTLQVARELHEDVFENFSGFSPSPCRLYSDEVRIPRDLCVLLAVSEITRLSFTHEIPGGFLGTG